MKRNFLDFDLDDAGYDCAAGDYLSARGDWTRAAAVSATGEWRTDSAARWNSGGLDVTRAAVYVGGIFSFEAVGCRDLLDMIRWLRADRISGRRTRRWWIASLAACRSLSGRECGLTNSRRPRNRIGLRTRSAHFSCVGGISSFAGGAGARNERRRSARARSKPHRAAAAWISRRAARERARA